MSDYKPLISSAPAHSILQAQGFRYTNAASTDIRATFERIRLREAMAREAGSPSNVKPIKRKGV